MKMHLEIRAAEGGDDAKALVLEQAALYEAYAKRNAVAVTKKAELG